MSEQNTQPDTTPAPEAVEVSMNQVEELLRADEEAENALPEEEPAPEAAAAPEPEPEPDPNADPLDNPKGDLRVPLREERERRRAAEQRIEQLAQHQKMLAGYLEQLGKQITTPERPAAQQPQVPDFETDPAGHLRHQVDTLKSVLGQMSAQQQAQQQQAAVESQRAAAAQAVTVTEGEFAKKTPDYYDAVDFMREKTAKRFEVLGIPKDQIPAAVAHDMQQFGLRALRAGFNPAEKLFQLAKIEGYNGTREANADRLSTIAKGAAASRGARSSAPASNGELTLEQAARLPIKAIAKMSETEWQRLMGG